MLVLSRKLNEKILIDNNICITLLGIRGNQVRIGIDAPDSVGIFREEILATADRVPEPVTRGVGVARWADQQTGP